MWSKERLDGAEFDVPSVIEPEGFDWDQSRPQQAWRLKPPHRYHGYWQLRWIELVVPDLITVFGAGQNRAVATGSTRETTKKGRPTIERAKRGIDALWPGGPPDQVT